METGVSFSSVKGPLSGKSFCITGKLTDPRRNIEKLIERYGGSVTSINSCNYLICNQQSDSSKYSTAIEKNIPIISESDFKKMLIK